MRPIGKKVSVLYIIIIVLAESPFNQEGLINTVGFPLPPWTTAASDCQKCQRKLLAPPHSTLDLLRLVRPKPGTGKSQAGDPGSPRQTHCAVFYCETLSMNAYGFGAGHN